MTSSTVTVASSAAIGSTGSAATVFSVVVALEAVLEVEVAVVMMFEDLVVELEPLVQ